MSTYDPVTRPAHYAGQGAPFECIELTELYNFCLGNAIKYVWRAPYKNNPLEGLKKAKWYVEREWNRTGSTCSQAPLWMSREYRMLRTLERLDWSGAGGFWKALRCGYLQAMCWTLDVMIDLEQYGPLEER